jgi:hypothetical protein
MGKREKEGGQMGRQRGGVKEGKCGRKTGREKERWG